MKRLLSILILLLCLAGLTVPASAQSGVSQLRSQTAVSSDGSCIVNLTATLTLEKAMASPVFPIPLDAQDVTLNGGTVSSYTAASSRMVSLKSIAGGQTGTFTFTIRYRLPGVVGPDEAGQLQLSLQLLCGVPYPIDTLEASVTLPGEFSSKPTLSSGYHQENIDSLLNVSISSNIIALNTTGQLMDHETLTLTLPVDAAMFPQTARTVQVLGLMDVLMLVSVLLAIACYVLTLWPRLPQRHPRPAAPDGITAGELPQWFTGGRMDFSMLLVTWAQMGYLRILVTKSGRVKLQKRMEMGNERSGAEIRCFRELFGRRRTLDCGSQHYAEQRRLARRRFPRPREVYHSPAPVMLIFRGLCALSGLLGGITMADKLAPHSAFLQFILIAGTAAMAWAIQSAAGSLWLRRKLPLWIGLACAGIWLVLGIRSEQWLAAVLLILFQILAGIAAAWGGKRTELGLQALRQILGLRKFMVTADKQTLQQLLKTNPNYFHELAPYALGLGLDRIFAYRFARLRLPDSPYLIRDGHGPLTSAEWAALLRTAARTLDGHRQFKR